MKHPILCHLAPALSALGALSALAPTACLPAAAPCLLAAVTLSAAQPARAADPPAAPSRAAAPVYSPEGKLEFPENYREWVFLSSGLDMSYREDPGTAGGSSFDNVFADPAAYRDFVRTGTWPDRTMLILEVRRAAGKGSINRHGKFQTAERLGIEVHVKDTARFPGGWAFFSFEGTHPATQIPATEACYACHRDHAAVDTTFVQFYPTLFGIAERKGTIAPGYHP